MKAIVVVLLTLLVVVAAGVASITWMIAMPGQSWSGPLEPISPGDRAAADRLRGHVIAIASREHNMSDPAVYEAAAAYIEAQLGGSGFAVRRLSLPAPLTAVRNIEVEIAGADARAGIIVIGAHYDSVAGAPGANDNGSGVAAALELARRMAAWKPRHTWRFVFFANEEPPYFGGDTMGSAVYARAAKERGDRIAAMFSLETMGYYRDTPATQHYPFPLGYFYPDRGNFIAFVGNLSSRGLVRRTVAAFRAHAHFPSEGAAAPASIPGIDWSDHASFWAEGWPALMITDTAPFRYPHYHTAQDTPDKVDYERLARVVSGLEAAFRDLDASAAP
jgi:Zn-dependent M28 family amino/carboxypeptidase